MMNTFVSVDIGKYCIQPHPTLDGRVFVEIQRMDGMDAHGHPITTGKTIDLDELFAEEQNDRISHPG